MEQVTEKQITKIQDKLIIHKYVCPNFMLYSSAKTLALSLRLRSHRSRLFGYTVYVFEGTRILEIKHY